MVLLEFKPRTDYVTPPPTLSSSFQMALQSNADLHLLNRPIPASSVYRPLSSF